MCGANQSEATGELKDVGCGFGLPDGNSPLTLRPVLIAADFKVEKHKSALWRPPLRVLFSCICEIRTALSVIGNYLINNE